MKTFRFVLLLFLVLSISNTAWAQNQTVKGRVMDSKLKEPLMGGSILEIGTSNGTVTDLDGNFTLSVPKGVVLRISYVGYLVQEDECITRISRTFTGRGRCFQHFRTRI